MSVRPLIAVPRMLCASPAYLATHGHPQTAQDLLEHDCLLYRSERDGRFMRWPFARDGRRVDPRLRVAAIASDVDSLAEMAAAGGGIVWLGSFIAHRFIKEGRLVPIVLKPEAGQHSTSADAGTEGVLQFEEMPLEFFACFRDRQYVPAKVRALVDYLVEVLPQQRLLHWPLV